MGATMRDVAKLADVSQRTVSNVVNDYPHVRPHTRQRVLDAIAALRYRPNVSAQKLRRGRTGMVALALPEIRAPYFAELADHLQRRAAQRGITLLMEQTGGAYDRELLVLDGYHSNIIDGLIISPEAITVADLTNRDLDFPTVLLGESVDNGGVTHVSIDNVAAARTATEHLLQLGRRRIATVGSMTRLDGPAVRRLRGHADAMSAADLPVATKRTFPADTWTQATGYAIATEILQRESPPDGVFCFNDSLALGLMQGLHTHGVHIPDDIAIVGWDDIENCTYATPTLTSISPDKAQIALLAIDHLLDDIAGTPPQSRELTAPFHLAVRESSVPASHQHTPEP